MLEEVAAEVEVAPRVEEVAAEAEVAPVNEALAIEPTAELGESDKVSGEAQGLSEVDALSSLSPAEPELSSEPVSPTPPQVMPEPPPAEMGPPDAVFSSEEPGLSRVQSEAGEPAQTSAVSESPVESAAVEERYPRIADDDDDEFSGLMALDARRNLEVGDLTSADPTMHGDSLHGFADVEEESTLVVEIPNEA